VDIGGLATGKALPARVLEARGFENGDVALLKIEAENAPALELAGDAGIEVGTEVVSVGFPGSVDLVSDQSSEPSFKEGSISSQKTRNGVRTFEISAAVSEGMSGGPTVDLRGRVIGVNSFGPMGESQAFNFVSSSAEVEALLADLGVENKLGKTNATYREGLAAYYAGDREEALAKFGEVLELVRPHELAQEFRSKALRLPKAPTHSSPPSLIAGGIALALASLALIALVVWRRRRRRGGAAVTTSQPPHPAQPTVTAGPVPHSTGGNGSVPGAPPSDSAGSVAALVATDGPLVGLRIPVAGELVLGRGMVDVRIDDPQVSWRHASVSPLDGGLVIGDLQSLGGTYVNGQCIEAPVRLVDGDELQLGATTMRVEIASPMVRYAGTAQL
jgi:serine protease Do